MRSTRRRAATPFVPSSRVVQADRSAWVAALLSSGLFAGAFCGCGGGGPDSSIPGGGGSAVNAGADRTVRVGDAVVLMGTSTGVATHKWELMSRPSGSSAVVVNETSLTNASFIPDREGQYVAKLIGAVSNNPTAPDVNPAATDTVTITAVSDGGTGGTGGGTGGTGGTRNPCDVGGRLGDVYPNQVDDSLTTVNDASCGGNCIGEPANATGAPDFVPNQGGTTVSLGKGGTLGLVFGDEPCVVDDDENTPDLVVCERGGVQIEDFSVDAAVQGEGLAGNPIQSVTATDQVERWLDLTSVIGGAGLVERIQIIDIDGPPDEPEQAGSELAWGADIDAVACFPR